MHMLVEIEVFPVGETFAGMLDWFEIFVILEWFFGIKGCFKSYGFFKKI